VPDPSPTQRRSPLRRHRLTLLLITALAAVALLLWFALRPGPTRQTSSTERSSESPAGPRIDPAIARLRGLLPAAAQEPDEPELDGPTREEVENFRRFRIESLRSGGRYPGDSRRLTQRHVEALSLVEPQVSRGSGDESEDQREDALVASATKLQFQDGEAPIVTAEVVNLKTRKRLPARITAQLVRLIPTDRAPEGAMGDLPFRDDGLEGDEAASDLLHTAKVDIGAYSRDALVGQVHVEVKAVLADGRTRFVVTAFRYGSPGARLTGKFFDRLEEGHLILEAEVQVSRPARFHLQGGLVSENDTMVAWAQKAGEMEPGTHMLQLRFFGLAFHEAGENGPYTLSFIVLSETGVRPVLQGDVLENAHVTKAYGVADFSSAPNHDPALEETIQHAEQIQDLPVSGEGPPAPPARPRPPPPPR
jgi:hypothetical protein